MRERPFGAWLTLVVLLTLPVLALSQAVKQNRTLVVNGQPGEVTVIEINGRSYVELEALARLANGSLGFNGNQIMLTLPGSATNTPMTVPATTPPATPGFSKDFLRTGIEEMAVIREWRSTLKNAIRSGYPVTDDLVGGYRSQAAQNLRLASVAVSTDSDRNALQLLTNEFNNMKQLSDRFVEANKSMRYVSADALNDDPLDQKILSCAHSLASMAASGQFVDDGSCQ